MGKNKLLIKTERLVEIYDNDLDHFNIDFEGQKVKVFFGKGILEKTLKKILGSHKLNTTFSESYKPVEIKKKDIDEKFGTSNDSCFIVSLGGASAMDQGKIMRNKDDSLRLISIPTSCSNDAFFTNKYTNPGPKKGGSSALSGKLPDYVIVDVDLIDGLVNDEIIYSGWGEFLSIISSFNDWKNGNGEDCSLADVKILDKLTKKMMEDSKKVFDNGDFNNINVLMKLLFMKCLYMLVYDDNTIGASSDHMVGYGLKESGFAQNQRHGQQVMFGSILACACYDILDSSNLVSLLPKQFVEYIMGIGEFNELIDVSKLKELLTVSRKTRNRKTIFDRLPEDKSFYEKLEETIMKLKA